MFRGEVELTDTAVVKDIAVQQITCDETHSAIGDPISLSGLLYIDSQFHLNWKTPRIAEACYRATVTAQDDSTLNAVLQLK